MHVMQSWFLGYVDSHSSYSSWLNYGCKIKALFGFFFITHYSSLNFRHSSLKIPHPVWHYHSLVITQYFSTVCGHHTCHLVRENCFMGPTILSFLISPPSPLLLSQNTNPNPVSTTITKTATTTIVTTTKTTNPNPISTTITKIATTTKCGQSDG